MIHDKDDKIIGNSEEKYQTVKKHFHDHFYNPEVDEIQPFIGDPRPLENKITRDEVKAATKAMNNNKAMGDDGIPLELLKYGPDELADSIANILNTVLETHNSEIQFGQSILLPMLKPKKTPGPVKHLRPLNLLTSIRKTLSNITLNRIKGTVDNYLAQSQAAYRKGRSTTDVVWAHRFVAAKVQKYQDIQVNITGLDMSSAFDTVERAKLLSELESIVREDESRMCRLLLSKTSMELRFENHPEEVFVTNKGSPQGDAISGTFFNIAFERALRDLRTEINKQDPMIEHSYCRPTSMPPEMVYADDSDFLSISKIRDTEIQCIAKPILQKHGLTVNHDKW